MDTDATIAEQHNNVIESVHDGNNELLRDVSSSATVSAKEMTVSHLNRSRQNIVVDRGSGGKNVIFSNGPNSTSEYSKLLY